MSTTVHFATESKLFKSGWDPKDHLIQPVMWCLNPLYVHMSTDRELTLFKGARSIFVQLWLLESSRWSLFFSCIFHSLFPVRTRGISRVVFKTNSRWISTYYITATGLCAFSLFISFHPPTPYKISLVPFDRNRKLGVKPLHTAN